MKYTRKPKIHIHMHTSIHLVIKREPQNSGGKIYSIIVKAKLGSHLKQSKIESIPLMIHQNKFQMD